MKKVKLQLPTNTWDQLNTKYAPDDNRTVDQNAFTEGTKNIDTESDGTIRKMKGGTQFYTLSNSPKDQFETVFSDGTRHLLTVDGGDLRFTAGTASSTSVTSGYTATANFEFATSQDRVYFGNTVVNQVYDKTASYGGVGYSVPQTKTMGCQVPGSAPTATLGAAGSNVPAGAHTYKVAFLYYGSEESNGSAASNLVTVTGANEQVDLSAIPTGGYGVTARKIYRDNNDNNYVLVGTISDNTTTTFSDTVAGGTTPIPTDNGIPPVFGQIKLFLDRLWFGQISGEPFTLYFSEVGLPDIVQSTNFIDCNPGDPITSLFVYRGRLMVFNRRSIGQILGDTKDSFRYDPIESSIGCVDNRSIQEIVLQGVPILIWLSDKGFYGFNGSSVFYLSDSIENLVNVNIRQAVVQKNQHVDTSDADFNAGTASDGIAVAGGQISTRGYVDGSSIVGNNPRRTWNDTADWDGGTSFTSISTINQSNQLSMVPDFGQDPRNDGTKDNVITSGSQVVLETSTDFTGESRSTESGFTDASIFALDTAVAYPIIPTRTGTLDSVTFAGSLQFPFAGAPGSATYRIKVWSNAGSLPNTELYSSGDLVATKGALNFYPYAVSGASVGSLVLQANTKYWFGVEVVGPSGIAIGSIQRPTTNLSGGTLRTKRSGSWITPGFSVLGSGSTLSYAFTSSAIAASGTWTSEVYDTQSTSTAPTQIEGTITYPSANEGSTTTITGGNELDFAGNVIPLATEQFTDFTGTQVLSIASYRYYQVAITLTTTDDRNTPGIGSAFAMRFPGTAIWISDSVDTTADSTTYNALTTVSTTPGSTTVTTEIRTAATEGGLSAAPWVAFGSVTVRQWAQIRLTLTKDFFTVPSVTSVNFTWTIVSNLISDEIDTSVTPSGWDIFRAESETNGGTIVYEMRSAASSGALSGATWYTVTNGNFPTASLPTLQYVQWRATITASDTNVPTVSSVTITWFIGDVESVRAASIFYNKNYYIALAELGNDENNMLIQLDATGKWRIKRGLGISTFSFFFNEPYFGQSTAGVIGKFLDSLQDLGTNIEIDIRTRAFDFSSDYFNNSEFIKVPESFTLEGRGTGATYDVSYSVDNGVTFTNMVDVTTGSTTYATTNDDQLFARVFRIEEPTGARTIMYRVHTNDEFDIKLHRLKATAFITQREPIITG